MTDGTIIRALSGFYYVRTDGGVVECRARGRFRLDGSSPLVGDRVQCSLDAQGRGRVDAILPRRNWFIRPAVANIDVMVFVAANANPVTDPFLIDRVTVISAAAGCDTVVCVNKCDLDPGDELAVVATGRAPVTVSGEPSELVLWLFGRERAAEVRFSGPVSGLAKLRARSLAV